MGQLRPFEEVECLNAAYHTQFYTMFSVGERVKKRGKERGESEGEMKEREGEEKQREIVWQKDSQKLTSLLSATFLIHMR